MLGISSQQGTAQLKSRAPFSLILYISATNTSGGFNLVLNFQIRPLLTILSFRLLVCLAYTFAIICQCIAQPPCFIWDFNYPPHWCQSDLLQTKLDLVLHQQKVPSWPVLISPVWSALPLRLGNLRTGFPEGFLLRNIPVHLLMLSFLHCLVLSSLSIRPTPIPP